MMKKLYIKQSYGKLLNENTKQADEVKIQTKFIHCANI